MLPNLNSPYNATENTIGILKGSFSNKVSSGTGAGLDISKQNSSHSLANGVGCGGLMARQHDKITKLIKIEDRNQLKNFEI